MNNCGVFCLFWKWRKVLVDFFSALTLQLRLKPDSVGRKGRNLEQLFLSRLTSSPWISLWRTSSPLQYKGHMNLASLSSVSGPKGRVAICLRWVSQLWASDSAGRLQIARLTTLLVKRQGRPRWVRWGLVGVDWDVRQRCSLGYLGQWRVSLLEPDCCAACSSWYCGNRRTNLITLGWRKVQLLKPS